MGPRLRRRALLLTKNSAHIAAVREAAVACDLALDESGGNWAAAARALGMARSNLHHMADRLGLRK